jgi:hypothetical protein
MHSQSVVPQQGISPKLDSSKQLLVQEHQASLHKSDLQKQQWQSAELRLAILLKSGSQERHQQLVFLEISRKLQSAIQHSQLAEQQLETKHLGCIQRREVHQVLRHQASLHKSDFRKQQRLWVARQPETSLKSDS